MNLENYKKQIKKDNMVISIDFDGVIHRNSKGFHDGTIYDKPVKGTKKSLRKLYTKGFDLVISTCKADPDRPLVNGKNGIELVWEWLEKWELDQYIMKVTNEKPRALFYIDDKGIRFESWKDTLKIIEAKK